MYGTQAGWNAIRQLAEQRPQHPNEARNYRSTTHILAAASHLIAHNEGRLGKTLFTEIGCATCHRPTWTTGDDVFTDPNGFFADGDSRLPRYPNQKIWPYSDMVQHRLFMVNDIRTGWCRTTPLWGRGLSEKCTGASDRLHDCRARTVIEAIMWHGAAQSDARWSEIGRAHV